jgi:predicted DNA-binding antitoxin AbrB/MazE fold protein
MVYHGHIENGLVVFDQPVDLPDGARVSVHIQMESKPGDQVASVRAHFGSLSSGDACSADNVRIDEDLAQSYGAKA